MNVLDTMFVVNFLAARMCPIKDKIILKGQKKNTKISKRLILFQKYEGDEETYRISSHDFLHKSFKKCCNKCMGQF